MVIPNFLASDTQRQASHITISFSLENPFAKTHIRIVLFPESLLARVEKPQYYSPVTNIIPKYHVSAQYRKPNKNTPSPLPRVVRQIRMLIFRSKIALVFLMLRIKNHGSTYLQKSISCSPSNYSQEPWKSYQVINTRSCTNFNNYDTKK